METKKPEHEVGRIAGATGRVRRRYSAEEKLRMLTESEAPGSGISAVARKYGVSPSLLFRWRHLRDQGRVSGLKAGEALACLSEVQHLKAKVRELQRLLGKKTEEAEILREIIVIAREKKLLSAAALSKLEGIL